MFQKLSLSILLAKTAVLLLVCSGTAYGATKIYFEEDFEQGTITTSPQPEWSWKPPLTEGRADSVSTSMMFGTANDIYSVSSARAYTGNHSWRLNFAGRNNWCNQCGVETVVVTQSHLDNGSIPQLTGPWGDVVFNLSNGFSTWKITDPNANQLTFNKNQAESDSLFGMDSNALSVGDELKIPYQCGINGIVGGRISRRSDCNKAINYLNGISDEDFGYGKKISRRFYMYIPSSTVLPGITLKLGYAHFRRNGSSYPSTLKLSVQRDLQLELSLPGGKSVPDYRVEKDKWYYYEEVWTRESAAGANDGSYELYVSPEDNIDPSPVVRQSNIQIGSIVDMSINGNFQHNNDASGSIYFDSIVISDGYNGPVDGAPIATRSKPEQPSGVIIEIQQ